MHASSSPSPSPASSAKALARLAGAALLLLGGAQAFVQPAARASQPAAARPSASSLRPLAAAGEGKGPIQVTPELIKHTATLAQLQFDDAEVAALVPRFQAFLSFVDKMQEVPDDAPGLKEGALPPVEAVLRADASSVFGNQEGIFANMAQTEDAYLVVPKVGEEDT